MPNIAIGWITMNAGDDIPGSMLKYGVKKFIDDFDKIVVVDGNLTSEAQEFYNQFDESLIVVNSPWQDYHLAQYYARTKALETGDWLLALDDDEIPSPELVEFCKKKVKSGEADSATLNMIYVPCILHLTDNMLDYYAAQEAPKTFDEQRSRKHILHKIAPGLDYIHSIAKTHVTPCFSSIQEEQKIRTDRATMIKQPYYHMKSMYTYVVNDCLAIFKEPLQERCTLKETEEWENITKHVKSMIHLREITNNLMWTEDMKKFAIKYRHESERPISRFYYWYYIILQPELAKKIDSELTSKVMTKNVLGVWFTEFNKNKVQGNNLIL